MNIVQSQFNTTRSHLNFSKSNTGEYAADEIYFLVSFYTSQLNDHMTRKNLKRRDSRNEENCVI